MGNSKSLLQKFGEFYMYSSLHIGLCAFGMTLYFFAEEWSMGLYYSAFVAFATIGLYGLHRLVGINKTHGLSDRGRFAIIAQYQSHIKVYTVISISSAVILYFLLPLKVNLALIIPSILSLLYSLPLWKGQRLRDVAWVKIFLVAFCWSVICGVIPLIYMGSDLIDVILIGGALAIFFLGITLPFDIRDQSFEEEAGIITLVSLWGEKKSWFIAQILLVISAFIIYFNSYPFTNAWHWAWVINITSVLLIIQIRKPHWGDWYYSLILDGSIFTFLLWFILLKSFI